MRRLGILCAFLLTVATLVWGGSSLTITASDNAWVYDGQGDQSEASTLTVSGTTRLAYLRFNIAGLSVLNDDHVYLDLYFTCHSVGDVKQLKVAALNDGVAQETTWDASLTYAARPDGTSGPLNGNTAAVATYNGRVLSADAGTNGRDKENPPGQIAIVMTNSVLQSLLADDTNGELTLILYGSAQWCTVASLGSANLKPQLRLVRGQLVETIPESIHGGQYSSNGTWSDSGTTAEVGDPSTSVHACQFLAFELPKRPTGGFKAGDTSLEITLKSQDITGWGQTMVDIWAVGYVPAAAVPLTEPAVDDYYLMSDNETKAGWNLGGDLTEKIYNNLTSSYSSPGRYGVPPEACTSLTSFINDLFDSHGAGEGDYLILRGTPDVNPDPRKSYFFYTGNAAENLKPVLTLSPIPQGMVILVR